MANQKFGPYQTAANKWLQFAIDNKVANADKIVLDGQLGVQWRVALHLICRDAVPRARFEYGPLREVRDDSKLKLNWFRFVGDMPNGGGHFDFIELIGQRASKEAADDLLDSVYAEKQKARAV